jgi:FtsX-like permease family protein
MRGLTGVGPLAWQRLRASWRLLSVLASGILAAATLMALSPVYTRVMNDLGLEYALKQQIGSATHNSVNEFDMPLGTTQAANERGELARLVAGRLSWLTSSEARYGSLPNLNLAGPDGLGRADRALVTIQTLSGFEDHSRIVEGRQPTPTADPTAIEGLMPVDAARFLGLKPGDRISARQQIDDCNRPPPSQDPQEARDQARFACVPQVSTVLSGGVTVTGFVEPGDPAEPFWAGGHVLFNRPQATETSGPVIPVVLPEESFYQALPRLLPGVGAEFRLTAFIDTSRLNSGNLGRARDDLAALRAQVAGRNGVSDFATQAALDAFQARASFNQIPLLLLLLQVVGVSLYFVVLVAAVLADRRAGEIALLRSRGATVLQIVAVSAVEAGIIAGAAALLSPFLAGAIVATLGKTTTFHTVSGGHFLPFRLPLAAFGFAAAGGGLGVLAVLVPAFIAARRGIVEYLQASARPGRSVLQRYYLDLGLAALAGLALWELNQRGSVFDPHSVGGWSADPVLLLSPLLLIAAAGALIFRFLPLVLGLISRAVSLTAGPGVVLGLIQLTRSPARYTQLALLVVMTAAIGVFAATYSDTTDKSQTDRARFATGVDLRITDLGNLSRSTASEAAASLRSLPGVTNAAAAYRTTLNLGPLPGLNSPVPVLALDPAAAADLVWFRSDFAAGGEAKLLRNLYGSPAGGDGIQLPGEPVAVSVWVSPAQARPGTTVWARTRDSRGLFRLHELGTLDYTGYRQLTAHLNGSTDEVQYPVSLLGLFMTQAGGQNDPVRAAVFFDDLSVTDGSGNETVVEDFEGAFRWDAFRTATMNRDMLTQTSQGQRRGNSAAQYAFRLGSSVPLRGLYLSDPNIPLPAVASENFLTRMHAAVGNEVELVVGSLLMPVKITGSVKFFPTMEDTPDGFLILNQAHLYYFASLTNQGVAQAPNEGWLTLAQDKTTRAETIAALGDRFGIAGTAIVDQQKVLETVRSDPVVRAGGSGILLVSLVAALLLLGLGFGITLYVGAQSRTVEIAVIRGLGFSRGQMLAMTALEYAVVAGLGLGVGALAGLRISQLMLAFLDVTEEGAKLVPPFVLSTGWGKVGIAFALIAVAFVAGIVTAAAYFLRLPVSRILRLTR